VCLGMQSDAPPLPPPIKRTASGKEATDEGSAEDLTELGLADDAEADTDLGDTPEEPPSPALQSARHTAGFGVPVESRELPSPSTAVERTAITAKLAEDFRKHGNEFLSPADPLFMHGWAYTGKSKKPNVLWASDKKPRKDHDAPDWLTASEFQDREDVMDAKVKQLAQLMRLSRHTCVYSGAGISASAVGQAALSGTNKVGWLSKTEAQPTLTHHTLAALGRTGWVHGWVQQNHDGLPQKAGFPQECINEVHGSWYDPSNPVVKYSGSLKDHECEWMERETLEADLVLVMGTSLGGLFADQVATECAMRAMRGASLGAVLINLQQTPEDGKMSLKISGKSDDVLVRLLAELGLPVLPKTPRPVQFPPIECCLVPYDMEGRRLPAGSQKPRMWLDLRAGAKVKLSKAHNIQNAKQPMFMHIGSKAGQKFKGKSIERAGKCPGEGAVVRREDATASFKLNIEAAPMRLGIWWLEAAARGGPAMLPVVNSKPVFEGSPDPSSGALKVVNSAAATTTAKAAAKKPSTPNGSARTASPKGSGKRAASPKGSAHATPGATSTKGSARPAAPKG